MHQATSPFAAPATIAAVTRLVEDLRAKSGSTRAITPTDSLTDAGVSSLDMVNLMLAVEASFDLFIPSEMIGPESFRSIATIAGMVETLKAQAAAA